MRHKITLIICIVFTCCASANSADISIAEISGNEIRKLTSSDWSLTGPDNSIGCLIDVDKSAVVEAVSAPEIYSGCSNYTFQKWRYKSDSSSESEPRNYGLLIDGGNCLDGFILPVITEYKGLPIVPSYIDLEKFKQNFKQDILIWYAKNQSHENSQEREHDLYIIERGDFPKIQVDLIDFKYPQGGGHFHNLKIYLQKSTNGEGIRIEIADYWIRVYDSSDYKVIHEIVENHNWFKKTRGTKSVEISERMFGPYTTGGKYYFINESFGYESKWLKLFSYPVWGEDMNKATTIAEWSYGC